MRPYAINGNAIYNLRHPWLRSLHEQLAREAFTEELAQIPFDLRMANLTLEAQRGSQELLGKAFAVPVSEEVYQDDSKLIGSFGSTLLNHSFEPGVFIRQGSSRNSFFNLEAEISLGVAAFEADLYHKFNETLTSRHPFRKVLVLSYGPPAIQLSESMATPRGPTEVRFNHAKTSRHLALCEIASQVTTKFFIFSDIYHLISGPASVLVDGEGRPVLPYLDANSPDCASTFGCGPSLQQARQLFGIQLQRHFDTFDVVLRTAQIQRFCEDWQLAAPQGSFETCAVEFGPTADDFFAWAISRGQSPFESYVPKDKSKVRWIPVMRRHAPAPMDLARPCSAYQQSDYERMKANISICSTIIENATRCEETITSHGPCVFNVFGHCTENRKMLHWPHVASEDSDSHLSRRLDMEQQNFSNLTTTEHTETTVMTTTYHVNGSNGSTTTETSHMTMMTTTKAHKISTNESDESNESTTSHTTAMTATTNMYKIMTNGSNGSTTTETSHMTMMTTTDEYMPGMNGSNGSTTTETSHMTMMTTTDIPGMNGSNGSTTTETSHMTMMTTTYMPGMNGSNGSSNGTMLVVPVAQLEGCVGLSVSDPDLFSESADAVFVMKRVLARAAGGVKVDYVHVSITAGSSCESGRRLSWGYRRLQDSVRVDYVIIFPASMGEGEALKQAENGKDALEQISLSEINALMSEEIGMVPSLSGLSVLITTSPTVMMTVFVSTSNNLNGSNSSTTTETSHMTMMTTTDEYMPGMNGSNGSTTTETSHMTMMTTTDEYMPGMNGSNGSTTTETSHMTMMTTTDEYMPGMNGSNGSTTTETNHMTMMSTTDIPGMNGSNGSTTTETSHMTMMTTTYMPGMNGSNGSSNGTMLVVPVAQLEGCVGLSVSDPDLFSESADAVFVMKRVLARAAGGVKVDYVHVSITAGSSCESGRRLSWGYRRLQDSVRVDYVIIFPASMGEGEALKQAENGKDALEQISLSEINALMSEEIGMVPSLSGLSVLITTSPTVMMTVFVSTSNNLNGSNGSTTTETSHMTMMTTTDEYMPGMNGSNGSTTTETSHMTMMTTTDKYMPGMNGSNGSTTTETSHMTMMTTTDMYMPGMNGSNGSTTTETSHMTMMTTTTQVYMPGHEQQQR
ncbi:unnamed protein product [Cladocopium goreaui]|uniref:Uncharacterized protein n=1 Tax=Cladocopium goreaui TaxID=2562237 RepID=A0A9P1C0A1_9DINO|nr:unnamed protein product [Cladocopium goreaui]